jgi:hypothetical protein
VQILEGPVGGFLSPLVIATNSSRSLPLLGPNPHLLIIARMWGREHIEERSGIGNLFMNGISIDVTPEEHQKLKALAALQGKSIKEYVIERTLGGDGDETQEAALEELESILDERIRNAQSGSTSRRTVGGIFKGAYRGPKGG